MESMTVPKEYLETLLRRADLHVTHADDDLTTHRPSHVSISKEEHGNLGSFRVIALQSSREYERLRAALINGGVPQEMLNLLTNNLPPQQLPIEAPIQSRPPWRSIAHTAVLKPSSRSDWLAEAPVFVPKATHKLVVNVEPPVDVKPNVNAKPAVIVKTGINVKPVVNVNRSWDLSHQQSPSPNPDVNSHADEETSMASEDNLPTRRDVDRHQDRALDQSVGQRTLVMMGLPDCVTHLDIVKVIRGGQLLNLIVPGRDRLARISFVNASTAEAFLTSSKRNGIYVLGKRVNLLYEKCPFFMSRHVGNKISQSGATRNLAIRNISPDMTSQSIRDDLKHIHTMEKVELTIVCDTTYVSLNSFHVALTTRSCLLSRLKYKNCPIDFYPDECEQPLPQQIERNCRTRKPDPPRVGASVVGTANRFQMLANEDSDDEAEGDGEGVVVE